MLIVLCLASYGGTRSAKDIAAFTGIPAAMIAQVVSKLRRARLIRSARGHEGGYCMAGPAEDVSLLDIIEAMGEREAAISCTPHEAPPSYRKLGSDPVSERGAERLAFAVRSLALVNLRVDGILREATLERLVFGREGPAVPDDFPACAAAPDPHAVRVQGIPEPPKRKERDYETDND